VREGKGKASRSPARVYCTLPVLIYCLRHSFIVPPPLPRCCHRAHPAGPRAEPRPGALPGADARATLGRPCPPRRGFPQEDEHLRGEQERHGRRGGQEEGWRWVGRRRYGRREDRQSWSHESRAGGRVTLSSPLLPASLGVPSFCSQAAEDIVSKLAPLFRTQNEASTPPTTTS